MARGPPEVRGRLRVCAEGRGLDPGLARELDVGGDVAGGLGMVCEARDVGLPERRLRRAPRSAARWRSRRSWGGDRRLDRLARELVPERDLTRRVDEDSGRGALVEPGEVALEHRLEQPQLGLGRDDRDRVEEVSRLLREPRHPCEHGLPDGVRNRPAGREHLGHEERVAARLPVQLGPVQPAPGGERRHGVDGERVDGQPDDVARRRELPEHDVERMRSAEPFVAEARGDDGRRVLDPAREQAEQVERRLVGAVDVLDHEERRPLRCELAEERVGELVGSGVPAQRVGQLAADAAGDLDERAQRPRRLERDAAAPEDAGRMRADGHAAQERGLPDPRLAAHEHEPARAVRGVRERGFQRVDEMRALEQLRSSSGHRSRDIVQLRTNRVHRARPVAEGVASRTPRCGEHR